MTRLGQTVLPGGAIISNTPSVKQVVHTFDWSDECDVTDMGHGPTILQVGGVVESEAERLAVIAACEEARTVETQLYFPSTDGGEDDRYYRVKTGPATFADITAEEATYTFPATALVPYIYDAATGQRVT